MSETNSFFDRFRSRTSHRLLGFLDPRLRAIAIDSALVVIAFAAAILLRYDFEIAVVFAPRNILPIVLLVTLCALMFSFVRVYEVDWRYASVRDLIALVGAVTTAYVIALAAYLLGGGAVPVSVFLISYFICEALVVARRLGYRWPYLRDYWSESSRRARSANRRIPVVLIGRGDSADSYLRALEREESASHKPVGIITTGDGMVGKSVRGVPVIGHSDNFEQVISGLHATGRRPRHIIFTNSISDLGRATAEQLIDSAERLGLTASRVASVTELRRTGDVDKLELKPIELTDLLERPQTQLDLSLVQRLINGRRVLVTGAGGSIGGELTKQIAALNPSELVLIENSEFNLYASDQRIQDQGIKYFCYICDITNPDRLNNIFDRHKPEIVFHAAALKHVPMVEANPSEGVRTNVFGTVNVADAVKRTGALAMVQISTDKVVNAHSVMGATKRLAELYCQAVDVAAHDKPGAPKFITVRFGNVLGSSGSVVPLFEQQLESGGPLTVTDPEMTRFFMTISEAAALTLQASAHGPGCVRMSARVVAGRRIQFRCPPRRI